MDVPPDLYRAIVTVVDDRMKEIKVTREDFGSLKDTVGELAEVQQQTGEKLERLAEAQERTEEKLERLAEAQERTEEKLERLAEAQQRTEEKLERLAEAQQRTEAKLEALIDTVHTMHADLSGQIKSLDKRTGELETAVGGISASIGYALENDVYRNLPALLEKRYSISVEERFIRRDVTFDNGKTGEVNIYATGRKSGKPLLVLGEVESKLGKHLIDELKKKSGNLRRAFPHEHFLLAATHYCRPEVAAYAASNGVAVVMTYEFL